MTLSTRASLSWLLAPISPEQFYRDSWERSHFVLHRRSPDYFAGLFSLLEIDSLLAGSSGVSPHIRIVNHGKELSPEALAVPWMHGAAGRLEAIYREYREGATLVFPFIHEQWLPLRRLCSALSAECSASFQANAYLTPRNSQGLNPHYDTHDVFVLQVEGSKHWQIYGGGAFLPLKDEPFDSMTTGIEGLLEEIELSAGDLLYVPRGCIHVANSGEDTSLHLTLGVNTVTWASVLTRALEVLISENPPLRQSLPPGFASDERFVEVAPSDLANRLGDFSHNPVLSEALEDAFEAAQLSATGGLTGHLLDLEVSASVDVETPLQRRDWPCELLLIPEGSASVRFLGKTITFPRHIEPELRFILNAHSFTASELPGSLDVAGRNVLVSTLIREGLLTVEHADRS